MLDLLHFFFEDDTNSLQSGEQADARDKIRLMIYSEMYSREYKHATAKSKNSYINTGVIGPALNEDPVDEIPTPVDPLSRSGRASKPFIPATKVNAESRLPFGAALDAPLGPS